MKYTFVALIYFMIALVYLCHSYLTVADYIPKRTRTWFNKNHTELLFLGYLLLAIYYAFIAH